MWCVASDAVTKTDHMKKTTLLLKLSALCSVMVMLYGCSGGVVKTGSGMGASAELVEAGLCDPELGAPFSYRKKIAILAADISDLQQASDMPGLDVAWSRNMQQQLEATGRFIPVDASNQRLHVGEAQQEWIKSLAEKIDAQFIIAIDFENLHVSRSQMGSGNYAIALPGMRRQLNVAMSIYDGYSGGRMTGFAYGAQVSGFEGDVINPQGQPVLKGQFLESELGTALAEIMSNQVADIEAQMACLPLMARVSKFMSGEIYVDLPGAAGVMPGDTLHLFRQFGKVDTPLGPVEVVRVFPESLVVVAKGGEPSLSYSPGMLVRAW